NRIKVCDDQTAKFEKLQQIEEQMRVCTTDLHYRHVLTRQLRTLGLNSFKLGNDDRKQQTLAQSLDQNRLVSEEKVTTRQRHVLMKKLLVLWLDILEPLAQVLDPCCPNSFRGPRRRSAQEVPNAFESSRVGDV